MAAPTIKALQDLYTALGGNAATVAGLETIPELLTAIAAQVTASQGGPLPTVTAEDNGSILKVVDGAWAKAEA